MPGPDLCEYPATGFSVLVDPLLGQVAVQYCRLPQEINSSYWISVYGVYVIGGAAQAGPNLLPAFNIGGGGGRTGFFCLTGDPDDALAFPDPARTVQAKDPEPVSAWKNDIAGKRTACVPKLVAAPPVPKPDIPDVPANQFPTGAVTNPADGNPSQLTNDPPH